MIRKTIFFLLLVLSASLVSEAQEFVRTIDIISATGDYPGSGKVTINQDPAIDSLLSRSINTNKIKGGLDGYRIQIYRGSGQAGKEESEKVNIRFQSIYQGIPTYTVFDKPNWFKIRVGNYRTKEEATKALYKIRTNFKDSNIVDETIEFPDLNK